ncbi:MAG: TolC family protein, partial [Bryobacteraceae bacterium]
MTITLGMIFWRIAIVVVLAVTPAMSQDTPAKLISKDDAVRIALTYNQSLRANRLNVDQSKANEITAGLKPNPTLSLGVDAIPIFMPQTIRWDTQIYDGSISYTVEKGGKREKRVVVAKDNTLVAAQTVTDNERNLKFQVVQAFINVLLAKSVLVLAKDDLANYSQEVELNHVRLVAGDLAEGDYL